jgi:hypothetical protein
MGGKEKSHWHAAEHRRGCRKRDLHCLSAASLQSPGSIEEHRASRLRRDKRHGGPFFGSFLWASKEMNTLTSWSVPRNSRKNIFSSLRLFFPLQTISPFALNPVPLYNEKKPLRLPCRRGLKTPTVQDAKSCSISRNT